MCKSIVMLIELIIFQLRYIDVISYALRMDYNTIFSALRFNLERSMKMCLYLSSEKIKEQRKHISLPYITLQT